MKLKRRVTIGDNTYTCGPGIDFHRNKRHWHCVDCCTTYQRGLRRVPCPTCKGDDVFPTTDGDWPSERARAKAQEKERAFWLAAKKAKRETARWPAWKKKAAAR